MISVGSANAPSVMPRSWATVDVKQSWKGNWVYAPNLLPQEAVLALAPEISTADLLFRVGRLKYPTATTFTQVDPLDLRKLYCRIRMQSAETNNKPISVFTGVIEEDTRELAPGSWTKGSQLFRAYGIPHLLDRNPCDNAWVLQDDTEIEIKWCPSFNEAGLRGAAIQGNRSVNRSTVDGVYLFCRYGGTNFSTRERVWTNLDIVEYLLARHPQAKKLKEVGIKLQVAGKAKPALDKLKTIHRFAGRTLWQCLNDLIDPRSGLGFYITIGEDKKDAGTVYINVISHADKAIKIGAYELPGNDNRIKFTLPSNWPQSHLVGKIPIRRTTAGAYDTVTGRSARIKVCCTLTYDHSTLKEGWDDIDLEAEYLSAGGDADGRVRDQYRSADRFAPVFCQHVTPRYWDWRAGVPRNGNTKSGDEKKNIAPWAFPDGAVAFEKPASPGPGTDFQKEFLRDLPFKEQWDYSVYPPAKIGPADEESRYRPILVAYYDGAAGAGPTHQADAKWHLVDKLSEGNEDLKSMHVQCVDGRMGFRLTASPRHYLAAGHMESSVPTETDPELDYEFLLATAFFETDSKMEVVYSREGKATNSPPRGKPDGREFVRRMVIDVPEAEYWYAAPGTVVDVDSKGKLVHVHKKNQVLRDDRPRLQAIVAFAAAWYGRERQSVKIPIRRLGLFAQLGAYVESISMVRDKQAIGTVVTARRLDFRNRSTTLETGFAAFDAVQYTDAFSPAAKFAGRRGANVTR